MRRKLSDVKLGEFVRVLEIETNDSMRRRLMDIGLIPGTVIECALCSPFGEPYAYNIRGTLMAIRRDDTESIIVGDVYGV